jgi:hypothetical protein
MLCQVESQPLLARCVELSLIEVEVEMIRAAGNFGFEVYYGDGTRLDVLRASGAETAGDPFLRGRRRLRTALCKAEFSRSSMSARSTGATRCA